MRWLNFSRPACSLHCVYCDTTGAFPHVKSYEHNDETLSLYACTSCESLIYDLKDIDAPIVSQIDTIGVEAMRNARYVLETGFSAHHVAMCALSALPDMSEQDLRSHVFVDVGAGMGMASYLVKTLFGMPTVTVEPSYTGKLAHEILGLDVQRAYFEDLPEALLADLANRSCCLHLNSVVEHLVDPFVVLRDMVGRAKVEVLAAIVPDGTALDFEGPFLAALPFLAPRDHRHLPTKRGMEMMLKRLGFAHAHVDQANGLLTGIGSRAPMNFPKERTTKLAEHLLLESLMRHPEPMVAGGGASRLLPVAIFNKNTPLMAELRARFPFEEAADYYTRKIGDGAWDDLPFHLGPSCYWLAVDAMGAGRLAGALSLLRITPAFADLIARDYPHLAMTALEFKWAALLLESNILAGQEEFEAAEKPLRAVLEAKADAANGPRIGYLRQAETDLKALHAKWEAARASTKAPADREAVQASRAPEQVRTTPAAPETLTVQECTPAAPKSEPDIKAVAASRFFVGATRVTNGRGQVRT